MVAVSSESNEGDHTVRDIAVSSLKVKELRHKEQTPLQYWAITLATMAQHDGPLLPTTWQSLAEFIES